MYDINSMICFREQFTLTRYKISGVKKHVLNIEDSDSYDGEEGIVRNCLIKMKNILNEYDDQGGESIEDIGIRN